MQARAREIDSPRSRPVLRLPCLGPLAEQHVQRLAVVRPNLQLETQGIDPFLQLPCTAQSTDTMAKFLTSLLVLGLAALALQATASVLPDANAKPNPMADGGVAEVMPGPGMPSLKELNLTSVQLSAMGKPEAGTSCPPT